MLFLTLCNFIIHNKGHGFGLSLNPTPTIKADDVSKYFVERSWLTHVFKKKIMSGQLEDSK